MELSQATTLPQVLGRFRSALDIDAVREGGGGEEMDGGEVDGTLGVGVVMCCRKMGRVVISRLRHSQIAGRS